MLNIGLFVFQSLTLTLDKDGNPGGYVSDCSRSGHSDRHVSIATQTGEVTVLNNEHDDLIAPGIPLSGMYHGAWPIDKGNAMDYLQE